MKKFLLAVSALLLCAYVFADEYKPFTSEFYQDFITAAWYEKHGEFAKAFEYFEKLNEALPENKEIIKSLANLSIMTENQEAMDKYIPILIRVAPGEAGTLSTHATWLWSKGKLNEALKLYEQSIKLAPDNADTIFKYVTLLSGVDSDRAVVYLKKLSKEYPGLAGNIAIQIANLYLKANDNEGAVDYLQQAKIQHPQLAEPYLGLVKIYERSGDQSAALQQYLDMERAGIADADILTKIGAYYVLQNKKDLSQKYFLKAKELEPGNPLAAQFLALNAQERGDFIAAIKYLTESADYAKTPSYHARVSYFYNRLGDVEKSAQTLKEAYEKFDKNIELGLYYSLALIDVKDYKEAAKVLERVLAADPKNEMALFHYAYALERQKKYKDMENALLRLIEAAPQYAGGLNFLGYYLVDKTKRVDEGGDYIKRALAIEPDNAAYIDSLAWYYYKKGDYKQALQLLEGIVDQIADDGELLLHIAAAYEALGDYANAAKYYAALKQLEPANKEAAAGLKRAEKKLKR